jgi:hypothetical protein
MNLSGGDRPFFSGRLGQRRQPGQRVPGRRRHHHQHILTENVLDTTQLFTVDASSTNNTALDVFQCRHFKIQPRQT